MRQKSLDIRVIIGNPPYAVSHHIDYPHLDSRIGETFAARSTATNLNSLYDSYIRAIRWGADQLGDRGVLAYVSNGGWIDSNTADGMRKTLAEEFATIHVFHLRGNTRTAGEVARCEGGQIFGSGSRAPIAITLFVKNAGAAEQGRILFHDIGDYLNREEKLNRITQFGSIKGISSAKAWRRITPDEHGDWLNQRDPGFADSIAIGDKRTNQPVVFENYSAGLKTQRDAWCYNASREKLEDNITRTITYYNNHLAKWQEAKSAKPDTSHRPFTKDADDRISWTTALRNDFSRQKTLDLAAGRFVQSLYRPFFKEWLYHGRQLNERVYQIPQLFPDADTENRVIALSGSGGRAELSVLMVDVIPSLHVAAMDGSQCFPLKLYEPVEDRDGDLFDTDAGGFAQRDAITDHALAHFRTAWPGEDVSKEDIFYYIYGLLHSPDYRERFENNLRRELPRIPAVKRAEDYRAFRDAGRALGDLHVNFETVEPYTVTFMEGDHRLIPEAEADPAKFYRVEKMRFAGRGANRDRSTVIYNNRITLENIPLEAYDYVVNGKPALEWVMDRQTVRTHKASGITNDANDYANETVGDPRYPLDLFRRVITVSLETMKIVNGLPELDLPE